MIKNEVYAGVWWYGARMGQGRKTRPRDEQIAVNVPAIIDRELWERAQLQQKKNTSFSLRNTKNQYLLRGLIKCGCGYAMCGHRVDRFLYYRCSWKDKWAAEAGNRLCSSRAIRADAIEADIWDEIKELFQDPDRFWEQLKAAQQRADEKLNPLHDKLQVTDDFIKRFKEKAKRINEELTDAKKGDESYDLLKQSQREVDARLKELDAQREKTIKELEAGRITDKRIETIMDFVRKVKRGIVKAENNFQAKRRLFEDLGVDVTVTPGKYHLKTILGEADGEISLIGRDGVRIVPKSSKRCLPANACSWNTWM